MTGEIAFRTIENFLKDLQRTENTKEEPKNILEGPQKKDSLDGMVR